MSKDIDPLSSVKEAFTHWRTTRLRQGKIPDYLWEQVRGLLNHYPIAKICSTLSISTVQIREKLLPKEDNSPSFSTLFQNGVVLKNTSFNLPYSFS